jgi:nucleoside-diphosphate-sugar epimerase
LSLPAVLQSEMPKKLLLCGDSAFAAQGLAEKLERNGYQVDRFGRAASGYADMNPWPAAAAARQAQYLKTYDAIVNFIVLRGRTTAENITYLEQLLHICRRSQAQHLIHISSMSVYKDSVRVISEDAAIKEAPTSESYASIKLAGEIYLRRHAAPIKLSLVRPACIIGRGMFDPVGSIGMVLETGKVLVLGPADRQRPLVTRDKLHEMILKLAIAPPQDEVEVVLAVDRQSPSCKEYLRACCSAFNIGSSVLRLPTPFWLAPFFRHQLKAGYSLRRTVDTAVQRMRMQTYNPVASETRLGLSFSADWERALTL